MLVLHSWLQEFLSKPVNPKGTVAAMEAAGIEVEAVNKTESLDSRIVVAKVEKLSLINNSKHLQLAEVNIGSAKLAVVCGAPNVERGQYVALAQIGARLPDGSKISAKSILGQRSAGMLCSPKELGLGDDHRGLLELEKGLKLGTPLDKIFGGIDTVFDVSLAANRPDLRSLIGIAREVAAHTESSIKSPKLQSLPKAAKPQFNNKVPSLVSRYALACIDIKNSTNGTHSPAWLQRRLQLAGIRPLNLLVDITNYAMLETGQPLHGFNADNIKGSVAVRRAKGTETITTLDEKKRRLNSDDIIIADSSGPVAIAGVMGGRETELTSSTSSILLEAAIFDGASIRRTAIRHNLVSEASLRFQHQLPQQFVTDGLMRALQLYKELAGAKVRFYADSGDTSNTSTIKIDAKRLSKLLGISVTAGEASRALRKLGFGISWAGQQLRVRIPTWRTDIVIAEDIYEEIIKLVGLDKIPARLPVFNPNNTQPDNYWPKLWQLRQLFRGLGASEVTNYPFVSARQIQDFGLDKKQHLRLQNPMSEEQTHLRTTLAPGLINAMANNSKLSSNFSMFEIGNVFYQQKSAAEVMEIERFGVAALQPKAAYQTVKHILDQLIRDQHLKAELISTAAMPFLHPARQAEVKVDNNTIAYIGELNPLLAKKLKINGSVGYLEGWIGGIFEYARLPKFQSISRLPTVVRDITLLVDGRITWQDVCELIDNTDLAKAEYVGDYHEIDGRRSITIRIKITPTNKTLTDKDINQVLNQLLKLLERGLGAQPKQP